MANSCDYIEYFTNQWNGLTKKRVTKIISTDNKISLKLLIQGKDGDQLNCLRNSKGFYFE
jgi:hypothetical protein